MTHLMYTPLLFLPLFVLNLPSPLFDPLTPPCSHHIKSLLVLPKFLIPNHCYSDPTYISLLTSHQLPSFISFPIFPNFCHIDPLAPLFTSYLLSCFNFFTLLSLPPYFFTLTYTFTHSHTHTHANTTGSMEMCFGIHPSAQPRRRPVPGEEGTQRWSNIVADEESTQ